uniref:Putative secreted peptide n=1 Tax=Anopheles braziliensis TaxID=58242 RepID=A0A2M3ZVL1_9DIPT
MGVADFVLFALQSLLALERLAIAYHCYRSLTGPIFSIFFLQHPIQGGHGLYQARVVLYQVRSVLRVRLRATANGQR